VTEDWKEPGLLIMKLLLCKICNDIFNLSTKQEKACSCGMTRGRYLDEINAEYSGKWAVPLGLANPSLVSALRRQPRKAPGANFVAFVIEKDCPTFRKKKKTAKRLTVSPGS
jgi:hypothetical protein